MDSKSKPKKQACDNCRRRKLKCNRQHPCDKCENALLYCLYTDVLQRKGPKFRHYYPRSSASSTAGEPQSPTSPTFPTTPQSEVSGDLEPRSISSSGPTMAASTTSAVEPEELGLYGSPSASENPARTSFPTNMRMSSVVAIAHVNIYLKYLSPIMPVVNPSQVLEDAGQVNRLSAGRYAFLASLCAATHLQLKLDGHDLSQDPNEQPPGAGDSPAGLSLSGSALLAEAVRARSGHDMVGNPSLDNLLASSFLFICYSNLSKEDHAWFYLCQAVSMVYILGLNRESSYAGLAPQEAETKRLIFWLLFVTERAYALQQSKPVTLRNSINKPNVYTADDPVLTYGLLHLINLFENIPLALYDCICSENEQGNATRVSLTQNIQTSLAAPISLEGVVETQQVDIRITQLWLQVTMWNLGLETSVDQLIRDQAFSTLNLPLGAAKCVMEVLSSVSQPSIDVHGIAMEQKLFEIGNTVAQIAQSLRSLPHISSPPFVVDPKDLLWGILSSLSNIRGGQSHLFPALLERASDLYSLKAPLMSTVMNPGSSAEDYQRQSFPISSEPWQDQPTQAGGQPWRMWMSTMPAASMPDFLATTAPGGVVFTQV